jgi:DNA (cytosine-5)-methyltransferase 1
VQEVKAVSLFAGIGGFDLALERNGIEVVASVEWDKHAQSVLKNRFPNSQIYGDIQEVTGEQLINAGFDPRNGIITGGFPCQDLSVAGKRAGLAGNRSGLFWEICRLLDETKTQYFILENVPGLLSSSNGADMGTVISALAQRGYGLAYRVLDAQYFGVPQRRRRVFIVGSLGDNGRTPAEILAISEGRSGYLEAGGKSRKSFASIVETSIGVSSGKDVTNCLPASLYHHGTVVNQDVDSGHLVLFDAQENNETRSDDAFLFQATRNESIRIFEKYSPSLAVAGWLRSLHVFSMHGAMIGRNDNAGPNGSGFLGEDEPSYTLTSSSQARHGVVTVDESTSMVRRLTPVECERLQGFPDNWTEGQADGHRYKQLGNAVAVPVVSWIIERLVRVVGEAK